MCNKVLKLVIILMLILILCYLLSNNINLQENYETSTADDVDEEHLSYIIGVIQRTNQKRYKIVFRSQLRNHRMIVVSLNRSQDLIVKPVIIIMHYVKIVILH